MAAVWDWVFTTRQDSAKLTAEGWVGDIESCEAVWKFAPTTADAMAARAGMDCGERGKTVTPAIGTAGTGVNQGWIVWTHVSGNGFPLPWSIPRT